MKNTDTDIRDNQQHVQLWSDTNCRFRGEQTMWQPVCLCQSLALLTYLKNGNF